MAETIRCEADNLIYNRYDIISSNEYECRSYENDEKRYEIMSRVSEGVSELNVWGRDIPTIIIERVVKDIFLDKSIIAIRITRGKHQYLEFLEKTNDIRVPLPETIDELLNRAERRDRATIRRKLRWLDERIGTLRVEVFDRKEIPESVVETYFRWKKQTHGTDYGLSPMEYLDKYYVTDAMLMKAGEEDVAVAFFCQVDDIVFFENFSYNTELKEYSPGLLMYVKLMEELIRRKCRYLYLGGGGYIYKTRFGAESFEAYSGIIYRDEIVDGLNNFLDKNSICNVSFYGFGVCGHSFVQLAKNLNVKILYGIDKNKTEAEDTIIVSPEDELPGVDAVFITLNSRNEEVEEFLNQHFDKVFYWNEILSDVIKGYCQSLDERA